MHILSRLGGCPYPFKGQSSALNPKQIALTFGQFKLAVKNCVRNRMQRSISGDTEVKQISLKKRAAFVLMTMVNFMSRAATTFKEAIASRIPHFIGSHKVKPEQVVPPSFKPLRNDTHPQKGTAITVKPEEYSHNDLNEQDAINILDKVIEEAEKDIERRELETEALSHEVEEITLPLEGYNPSGGKSARTQPHL